MYNFILPMFYLFESRLKSRIERISWFIIYVIPVFLLAYVSSSIGTLIFIILFTMAILSFFSLYEVGYIENDIKTTLHEKKPTIRIIRSKQVFLENNYYVIQFFKVLVTLILLFSIKLFSDNLGIKIYWIQFIICLFFMRVSFFAHNKTRSRLNVLTFMCLSMSKYFSVILLFIAFKDSLLLLVATFLMFPFLRTLEHSTKPKYRLSILIAFLGDHDVFRVKYYFMMLLLSLSLFYVLKNNVSILLLALMFYFFIYRVSALIFLRKRTNTIDAIRKNRYIK